MMRKIVFVEHYHVLAMKRLMLIAVLVFTRIYSFAQNTSDIDKIAQECYSLYDAYIEARVNDKNENAESISNTLQARISSLSRYDQTLLEEKIAQDALYAFENETNSVFIDIAERALFILPNSSNYSFDILSIIGDVYAGQSNREALQQTIDRMKSLPTASLEDNLAMINELQEKVLKIKPLHESINGFWIANQYSTFEETKNQPWLILDIQDIESRKIATISRLSALSTPALQKKRSDFRKSVDFQYDNSRGTFLFEFYRGDIHQGNAVVSQTLINSSQSIDARMKAFADRSDVKFSDAMTGRLVGGVVSLGLLALGAYSAESSVKEDRIYITGKKRQEDVLSSHIIYQQQVNSDNDIIDKDILLWRWKESDGIVFGDNNARPISPFISDLTRDMELYKIKKANSFWKAKYLLPMIGGLCVGGVVSYYGVKKMINDKRSSLGGALIFSLGTMIVGASFVVPINISDAQRRKAVAQYNEKQFAKLYEVYEINEK